MRAAEQETLNKNYTGSLCQSTEIKQKELKSEQSDTVFEPQCDGSKRTCLSNLCFPAFLPWDTFKEPEFHRKGC